MTDETVHSRNDSTKLGRFLAEDAPWERTITSTRRRELMGSLVLVARELYRVREKGGRTFWKVRYLPEDRQRAGWITGFSWRSNGKLDYSPGSGYGPPESVEWKVTSTVPAALVKYWPGALDIPVPEGGFEYPTDREPVHPSKRYWEDLEDRAPSKARKYRGILSEDASAAPRDSRGRFKKTGPAEEEECGL